MFKKIGPGVLVAAAFIGPGTVTTCILAGVGFGYALLWTMLLSTLATIVLQEMSARLGVVTQRGLADVIREELKTTWIRNVVVTIILAAIVIGNAAYEAGNIGGAALGLEALFGKTYLSFYPWVIGLSAFVLLYIGNYKVLEKTLVTLVIIMSLSFVATAISIKPDLLAILKGLVVPTIPQASILSIMALVGTTVVPYNLFLHASLVSEKWSSENDLKAARRDTYISISLGGLVSMCIIIAATTIQGKEVKDVLDLARGLEPLYGNASRYFIGIGLFAAGVTSAITAPLAAAYVANSCFSWKAGLNDIKFKSVWFIILMIGVLFLTLGYLPIQIIQFAQIANGILLPIIAVFLLWAVNNTAVMGKFKNTKYQNIIGTVIIVLAVVLGFKSILTVIGLF
ncbi:MAG: Nramp family divalent metal transporter [Flavobacteriaceae bacterium]